MGVENPALLDPLAITVKKLTSSFEVISPGRKSILAELAQYIRRKSEKGETVFLNFICTHNSRRSHIAQIWGQAAAYFYRIPDVVCLSGGTEATAFNPRAVAAMTEAGFEITRTSDSQNPLYEIKYSSGAAPIKAFSKKYDDPFNRAGAFAAVMTCSHADENCPFIPGAEKRIAITYDDPKEFDGTPMEKQKYNERVNEIGREILFAFSLVNS
jgi:arsenate reductase (thioredoxin)